MARLFRRFILRGGNFIPAALILALAVGAPGCTSKSKNEPPGTLHLASIAKIKGLDPAFADDLYSGLEVQKGYDSLYQYHYLKRPFQLIPNLAESMPEMSADRKTLTIKLKKGVVFHDDPCFKESGGKGREFIAEDVVYTYKRLADPKINSTGWWIFDEKIVGLNEWREAASKAGKADYAAAVEGLKAVDPYTIQIKLTKKSEQFIYFLAMTFASIVPREAVAFYDKEFLNHVVGTGPFRLEEFHGSSKIVWVRNPTYRKDLYPSEGEPGDKEAGLLEDAGKQLPFADKLVMTIYEESQPLWLNFMKGNLDFVAIPKDNFGVAVTPSKELAPEFVQKGIKLQKTPMLDITHYSFNMHDPLMGKNKYLRQAMSLAYDSGPLIELFYNGRAVAAQGPIPPGLAGYDKDFKNPHRQFNLAKAKELMAKAGYPDGKGLPPIEYVTQSDSTNRQMTEYAQKSFGAIGVTLKVNTYSWPEFQASVKNKKGQLWSFAWGADYPDAENFLQLFYSKNVSPGPNDANYANPEYDKLYEKALTLPDSAERTAIYKKMVSLLSEDCPWIFGVHRLRYDLNHPWLKNYKYHDVEHSRHKYLRVDPALKK